MPKKKGITRNMLTIATHRLSGVGHYVFKEDVRKDGSILFTHADALCQSFEPERAAAMLRVTTPATVTCQRCIRAFAHYDTRQSESSGMKVKEVKMLKTSDGKTFPLKARDAALKHEDELVTVKKETDFIADVKRVLFTDGDTFDEDLIEQFESDISDAIANHLEFGDITLKEYLGFLHEMLVKHGAKIRQMVILYQQIYGTLVPCRTTMENMKRAGSDIYL